MNPDGKVSVDDATCVQLVQSELMTPDDIQMQVADVNRDGSVDITDATLIQMLAAELLSCF